MNGDFDFNQNNNKNNEIIMSDEEKKQHKSIFSKLCMAFVVYLLITDGLGYAFSYIIYNTSPEIYESKNFAIIFSSVLQYAIAFPVLVLIMRSIPKQAPERQKLSLFRFFKYCAVGMLLMYLGNTISTSLMTFIEELLGRTPENSVETVLTSTDIIVSALIVGIIAPIVEELMFRKFFIDRLTPYGDAIAIFFPSFIFGLFHGNLYQFFYTFFLGIAFSYIYLRSGKIIYSTLLHVFVNLFCGVFPTYILSLMDVDEFLKIAAEGNVSEEFIAANAKAIVLLIIYEFLFLGAVFAGIYMTAKHMHTLRLNKGKIRLPRGEGADIMFFNPGAIALITACLLIMAVSTFAA